MTFTLLISFLFLFAGCSSRESELTSEEAIHFARNLEFRIEKGEYQVMDSIFLPQPLAIRTAAAIGKEANQSFIDGAISGIRKGLKKFKIGEQIANNAKHFEGSYEFVNHYVKNNKQHIIFRLDGSDGLNYHDFELARFDNKIGAADMFIFASGENISQTLARTISMLMEYSDENGDQGIEEYAQSVSRIKSLIIGQQYEKAKQFYDQLPAKFKKEKLFQIFNISITSNLEEDLYLEALKEFEKNFGNEPSTQLILFDSYFLKKEYTKALNALDVVDSALKGDPVLHYYRSLIYIQNNDSEKAIKHLELLHKQKPDYLKGLLELMLQYLQEKDIKKAETIAKEYKRNKNYDKEKMEMVRQLYPEFSE